MPTRLSLFNLSHHWNLPTRLFIFTLAAASIWCLLAEFYGLCSMRTFALYILFPATIIIIAMSAQSYLHGDHRLFRAVTIGALAGLTAAIAYDLFRLPFVFSRQLHLTSIFPPMDLFRVFPRFGAMLLAQPIEQSHYSAAAQLLGWTYHFSNGATFGIMFIALVGTVRARNWQWAIVMAAGIELAMLLTPYPKFFGIHVTSSFIAVTLTAHAIFGLILGLSSHALSRTRIPNPSR